MADPGQARPDYVLTHDLGERIQRLRSLGLEVPEPDHPLIADAQRQLVNDIRKAVPEYNVVTMQMDEVAWKLTQLVAAKWPDAFLISACPEIAPEGSMQIEVSRLYDLRGRYLEIGPRPGFPSLIEQLKVVTPEQRERGIVLMEDGVYSGQTVEELMNALKIEGIKPLGLVAGFAFDQPKHILERFERWGTEVVLGRELHHPVAWHPDHDFFPFVPGYGRVIGFVIEGRHRTNRFPLYTHNGASYAFPYLPQFSNTVRLWNQWSGLPDEAAETIGQHCMDNTIALFEEIERLNGREIHIGDLLGSTPRTNVPMQVGESDFPPLEQRVIDYLDRYK